jgi:hypothetical protein
MRCLPGGNALTDDDEVFKTTTEITAYMTWLSAEEKTQLLNLILGGQLSADSKVFSLDIDTEIVGRHANNYRVITDGEKILRWVE